MTDQSFPKSVRLRSQADFDRVYQNAEFVADDFLVIKGCRSETETTRLGLSVSKKVGNAVVRGRWKRAIREAFRKQRVELPVGLDMVARPRKGATCDSAGIHRSVRRLAERLDKKLS